MNDDVVVIHGKKEKRSETTNHCSITMMKMHIIVTLSLLTLCVYCSSFIQPSSSSSHESLTNSKKQRKTKTPIISFPPKGGGSFYSTPSAEENESLTSSHMMISDPSLVTDINTNDSDEDTSKKKINVILSLPKLLLKNTLYAFLHPFLTFAKFFSLVSTSNQDQGDVSGGFSVGESVRYIVLYLFIGVGCYSYLLYEQNEKMHWSIIDSLYFCVTTFSTVGYGDLTPITAKGKIFTSLFGLAGVTLLGAALASIGTRIIDAELHAFQRVENQVKKEIFHYFGSTRLHQNGKRKKEKPLDNIMKKINSFSWRQQLFSILEQLVPFFVFLFGSGWLIGRLEGWSFLDSTYYSIITCTTIGLGDLSPSKPRSRLLSVFLIPAIVSSAGNVIGAIASTILNHRRSLMVEKILHQDLTRDFEGIDTDRDGKVTRDEYVNFMLVELGIIDKTKLNELYEQFDLLDDKKKGYLEKESLISAALVRREEIP